jgi:hypothetical protein
MIIYSIYKIVNQINGKVYIGFDSNCKSKRYHKYHIKNRNQHIYLAFGNMVGKFYLEVIYQSTDGYHCLNEMEPYFIKEYNSYYTGYNETLAGEGTLWSYN